MVPNCGHDYLCSISNRLHLSRKSFCTEQFFGSSIFSVTFMSFQYCSFFFISASFFFLAVFGTNLLVKQWTTSIGWLAATAVIPHRIQHSSQNVNIRWRVLRYLSELLSINDSEYQFPQKLNPWYVFPRFIWRTTKHINWLFCHVSCDLFRLR